MTYPPPPPPPRRLLIVDDEEGPRHSLSLIFGDHYDVETASSGEEAVRLFKANPFAIVITDIRMKNMSGIEVLRAIRQISPHARVIILTAYETLDSAREAVKLGASDYLKKPFDVDHIERVVQRCQEEYRMATHQEEVVREGVNQAKNTFLQILGHELNTPMNGLLGMVDLLRGTSLDEDQKELLDSIQESGNRFYQCAQDILTYARLAVWENFPSRSSFNPATLVLQLIEEMAKGSRVPIECRITPDLPSYATGPENEIRLILQKLLENAVKFTEEGTITVMLEGESTEAGPGEDEDEDYFHAIFEVKDTGIGIPPEDLQTARIFDPFSQVDSSPQRTHGGLGLGLSVCHALCQRLGSELQIESTPGRGSRFRFSVRLVSEGYF